MVKKESLEKENLEKESLKKEPLEKEGLVKEKISKERLISMFESEEVIGVLYGDPYDSDTWRRLDVTEPSGEDDIAILPDGTEMGRCTNCADFVVTRLGEGVVVGFSVDSSDCSKGNKDCRDKTINTAGGHDFAVIGGRYIVDIWTSLYAGAHDKVVLDLLDPEDIEEAALTYGNPETWSASGNTCDALIPSLSGHHRYSMDGLLPEAQKNLLEEVVRQRTKFDSEHESEPDEESSPGF